MPDGIALWSIRTALLSVRDLDRSSAFYQDVLNVREVSRRYDMAILGTDLVGSPFTLCLRQAERGAILPGQQTIGIRALAYDVGSLSELDRIEARLRALDAFRDRTVLDPAVGFEVLFGQDPDRLALTFIANETGSKASFDESAAMARMYSMDA